jgi:hypothetical protein
MFFNITAYGLAVAPRIPNETVMYGRYNRWKCPTVFDNDFTSRKDLKGSGHVEGLGSCEALRFCGY